jgi:hypothetical protein
MARGKYLSLEEARKMGKLDQFTKEHPSEADGEQFERLLHAMTQGKIASEDEGGDDDATPDNRRRNKRSRGGR